GCGHTQVVLEGKWQRRFQKEFVDGEERGVVMQEESYVERYTAVVCEKCNTRTEIEPDHVVDLLADNVKLQMMAAESRGVTVVANPKLGSAQECVEPRANRSLPHDRLSARG